MDSLHIITILSTLTLQLGSLNISNSEPSTSFNENAGLYLEDICPQFKQCSRNELIYISGSQLSCCLKCSCKETCVENHSCCPNSTYVSSDVIPYRSQVPGTVCRNAQYKGEQKNVYYHPEYDFVQRCFDTANDETKQKCENATITDISLIADHIPIYNPEERISYGNIHCARCNLASTANVVVWQPKLSCKGDVDLLMVAKSIDQAIADFGCEVIFVPPSTVSDIPPCFDDVITECNVTGDMTIYDESDAYFCQHLDMLYVSFVDDLKNQISFTMEEHYRVISDCVEKISSAKNSKVLSKERYNQIVLQLTDIPSCDSNAKFRWWVKDKGYKLLNFPEIGLNDVLCLPAKKQNENDPTILSNWRIQANSENIADILTRLHWTEQNHVGFINRKHCRERRNCL